MYLGIDVGTGGVRCAVCTPDGRCVASGAAGLKDAEVPNLPLGRHEQQPDAWWRALSNCLRSMKGKAPFGDIAALSVDSTSGTVLFLDAANRPLRPALMYNDSRAVEQSRRVNDAAGEFTDRHGYRFNASFALAKILWVKEREPNVFAKTTRICHPADYVAGRIRGDYSVTDTSNALKTGCDLFDGTWPEFISGGLGIPVEKLPRLVAPGTPTGNVCRSAARDLALSENTIVVAGCTDGTAGFLASGAAGEGQWASVLGTTLVLRGISKSIVKDPAGRIYCHRHPDGWWLPGAACTVGGECLIVHFPRRDLTQLDRLAVESPLTDLIYYPLVRRGERFPFVNPNAEGFLSRKPANQVELHMACLEGVAFVERWAMDVFAELGADVTGPVHATGGGAKSGLWLSIRASVLGREMQVPEHSGCEIGAVTLAAAPDCGSVSEACRRIVRIRHSIGPDAALRKHYDHKYAEFRRLCTERGYV
ncbi:MAG TPA: FGGY-family carbohydrate kinase [Planctomycetota bacterium]|nr:FGGY-family carbohydrate kinase [Planctomycetota bacterium]